MGTLSTYGELKTGLTDYTGRGGNTTFLSNLPVFVLRAHNVLMRELRIPLLQASTTLSVSAEKVNLPADFRAVATLWIDGDFDNPLNPTSAELRMRERVKYPAGRPRLFALEGSQIAFGPAPDTTYTADLLYYRALDMFAADSDTNAVLQRYPFAYFYGALAEASRFDQFDENTATYEAMFQAELSAIKAAEGADVYSGGTLMQVASGSAV